MLQRFAEPSLMASNKGAGKFNGIYSRSKWDITEFFQQKAHISTRQLKQQWFIKTQIWLLTGLQISKVVTWAFDLIPPDSWTQFLSMEWKATKQKLSEVQIPSIQTDIINHKERSDFKGQQTQVVSIRNEKQAKETSIGTVNTKQ